MEELNFSTSGISINPAETGWYYLKSRYYDPEVGRFINADMVEVLDIKHNLPQMVNLYVYCLNNPIKLRDSKGNWPEWADTVAKVVTGVALVAATVMVIAGTGGTAATIFLGAACGAVTGGYFNELNGGSYTSGCLGGAISGAIQGIGGNLGTNAFQVFLGTTFGGSIGSGVGTFITESLENIFRSKEQKKTTGEMIGSAVLSATVALGTSAMTGLVGAGVKMAGKTNAYGLMNNYSESFGNMTTAVLGGCDDAMTYLVCMDYFNKYKKQRERNRR